MKCNNCSKFACVKKCFFDKGRTVFYMKISSSQMFRNLNKWSLKALSMALLVGTFSVNAQETDPDAASIDGGSLFAAKCATCHHPFKDGTGPKLSGVKAAWEENGAGEEVIVQWVHDWTKAAAANSYAASRVNLMPTAMTQFGQQLSDDEILAIFDWIDAQVETTGAAAGVVGGGEVTEEEEGGLGWIWIALFSLFAVIILSVGGVRRQLKHVEAEASGEDAGSQMSYAEELKQWAWLNRKYVGLGGLVVVLGVLVVLFNGLYSINIMEGYQPSQPIEFPHKIHAGDNGIDCKYCHNTVTESKSASIPSVNVCMNCHKQIVGQDEQVAKIQKIYDAAGWDPVKKEYTGKTKPIVWNKVHVLPDHVYFSHKQHVVVGQVDCKQCHGDMTTMSETVKVQYVEDLNKIDGNVQLTKSTLTMGWCIECHQEKEISAGPLTMKGSGYYDEIHKRLLKGNKKLYSDYLEDDQVSVKELGGWECAKCHY